MGDAEEGEGVAEAEEGPGEGLQDLAGLVGEGGGVAVDGGALDLLVPEVGVRVLGWDIGRVGVRVLGGDLGRVKVRVLGGDLGGVRVRVWRGLCGEGFGEGEEVVVVEEGVGSGDGGVEGFEGAVVEEEERVRVRVLEEGEEPGGEPAGE